MKLKNQKSTLADYLNCRIMYTMIFDGDIIESIYSNWGGGTWSWIPERISNLIEDII